MITANDVKKFCQKEIDLINESKKINKFMHYVEDRKLLGRQEAFLKVITMIEHEERKCEA